MGNRMARRICLVAAMSGLPCLAVAQEQAPAAGLSVPAPVQAQKLTSAQLADLVAPVALYPDALLSQVLVASTYPLEVVQAQQWLRRNERLKGQELMDAARQERWDASVQGLVAFPDALAALNQDIQWTAALGNAFLAQESDVMAAVQGMRAQAQDKGKLSSTPQQTVSAVEEDGRTVIEIEPADPQVVYVPQYDPAYVWGAPAWGAYPPLAYAPGYGFGVGIDVGFWFGGWAWNWGWGWGPNWYGGSVWVDTAFFRHCGYRYGHHGGHHGGHDGRYNGGHDGGHDGGDRAGGHGSRERWQHDGGHRMGVPYSNGRVASRYEAASRASRSTIASSEGWRRADGRRTSPSESRSARPGSRGGRGDEGWRDGTGGAAPSPRAGGTDQAWRGQTRSVTPGSRGGRADEAWRSEARAAAPGSRGGGMDEGWRARSRTEAPGSRGGTDRGWRAPGDQSHRLQAGSRGEGPSARYSGSSPRHSAPSPGYSAPSRSHSSSAPTRGFQSAPRNPSSSGPGRSFGGGGPQRSGGGAVSRGTGGGGGSHGGGRRH